MSSIFSGIQHIWVSIVSAVTTAILVISPFNKSPIPTPTPVSVQEEIKEVDKSSTPTPTYTTTNAPTHTPTPTPIQHTTTPPQSTNPIHYQSQTTQSNKKDYSSYKISLQNTLSSLKNRLANVQSSADKIPQNAKNQANALISRLESDIASLESGYNNEAGQIKASYASRGLYNSGMMQSELTNLRNIYDAKIANLKAQAEKDRQNIFSNAENQIYQANAQDTDLSNKISLVEGLINKINSESFTDSDVPLAIQSISY